MGSGFLAVGKKCLLSFTLIPISCRLSGKGGQTSALTTAFQGKAVNFRAIHKSHTNERNRLDKSTVSSLKSDIHLKN